jgi:phosphoglycerate dehydrogenase-like enzyme
MEDIRVLMTVGVPEEELERVRALSPRVDLIQQSAEELDGLPEGALDQVEVLYASFELPEPERLPNLKWVQLHFAGMDHVVDHPLLSHEGIAVTTLSGAAAPGVAEFVLMSMLALGRRLTTMMRDKAAHRWAEKRFERYRPVELRGSTVGIVGYGSIGREVARLCQNLGATVLAVKRDLKSLKHEGYRFEGLGDPHADIPERIYPYQAIGSAASLCDFLVIAVPLTAETRGLVDEKVLERMKSSAFLVDVSRGGVVDHGALVEALSQGALAGAALDVYPIEPLPERSPLWEMDNVILSPHVAGTSGRYFELAMRLFAENLSRYLAGKPLLNRFDAERGY